MNAPAKSPFFFMNLLYIQAIATIESAIVRPIDYTDDESCSWLLLLDAPGVFPIYGEAGVE